MDVRAYPLEKRVYNFREVFAEKNISDGYVIESREFARVFRKWRELNKE